MIGARLAIALGVLCAGCSSSSAGEAFKGTVVHVADGDTITVLRERREVRVRLAEIDSPERGQAFGKKARDATAALTIGQTVTVVVEGRDRYRRILADVLLPDGTSLSRRLVREGWAWQFRRYSRDPRLAEIEAEARVARRGLWADPHPVPPWDYRSQRRGKPRSDPRCTTETARRARTA